MLVAISVEDVLSEAVARRLLTQYSPDAQIVLTMGLSGNDYLKQNIRNFNQIARYQYPILVLTDLDRSESCPPELLREWTQGLRIVPELLIRVAVLEIESWIMADRSAFADWLDIARSNAPPRPEETANPKRVLVELARRSRNYDIRSGRSGLIRVARDGLHRPGPAYNSLLSDFAIEIWNPEVARSNAPSLDRAIARISQIGVAYP